MTAPRIAFLAPFPEYEEDWSHIKADYARLFGADTAFIDWTKADGLAAFDFVTPLLAWGYQRDCPRWFALLDRLETERVPVLNPVSVLRWNSDKFYLRDLSDAGLPVVPTQSTQSLCVQDLKKAHDFFGSERLVIKPPVSGGADGTYLLERDDPIPEMAAGQTMLIQPFVPFIANEGELSLFYFNGEYSHAIVKRPAKGDFRVQEQFGGREQAIEPSQDAKKLAAQAIAVACQINDIDTLAYARIDMIRDWVDEFMLMELELIEPSLFLQYAPDDGAAFAKALLSRGQIAPIAEP